MDRLYAEVGGAVTGSARGEQQMSGQWKQHTVFLTGEEVGPSER